MSVVGVTTSLRPVTWKVDENDENSNPSNAMTQEKEKIEDDTLNECNYDKSPTKLYSLIQSKKWDAAIEQSSTSPYESKIWVYRKERDGAVRWRLLPLHAAIIFKAPEKVVESLLYNYPLGAQCKDDQGMLPLHLAFRNKCSEVIVNLLLMAHPKAIGVGDRKRRLPLTLAQLAPEGDLRNSYIGALQKAPGYFRIAQASIKASPDPNAPPTSNDAIIQGKKFDEERLNLTVKIKSLEAELARTKDHGTVVVNHVTQLEAQLNSRVDTERFLATKIATLDTKVKELTQAMEVQETEFTKQHKELDDEKVAIEGVAQKLADEISNLRETVGEQEVIVNTKVEMTDRWEAKIQSLEEDKAHAMAQSAVVEAQLKMKVKNEQSLATQVSDLASKIADGAQLNSTSTKTYTQRIDKLEVEKTTLERSLADTNGKLKEMIDVLDVMTAEQLKIVDCATNHEKIVIGTMVQQEQIMVDAARQEENISEAAKEREQIVEILTRQATEIERTREDREKLVKACKNQEKCVSIVMGEKDKLVQSIGLQKNGMEELRKSVSELYKHTTYSDGSPKFDTTELASSPKFDTTELAGVPKIDKIKVAIAHQFDKTELARFDKQGVAKAVDDKRINTKPEEKAEEVVLETVLLEPGNDFENMESNNMLNSSTIVISSPPTNYKGDNYEMNKEQAIQEEVHNALNRIKSTRAAQSSSLTQQANAGIGNTIPTSITVDRQEEALTAESKRLNRDLFYAKENKIREAIQSHQGGGQKVPTTTSKDVSSIPPSSTIQATLSMNQSRQNFSDRPLIDPPSMVSNNQNEPNLTIHPTSSIPSGIHMNRRDQNPHIPTSVHMTQLPFQPTTVHMNQNHHLPGSAHMNQNHHLNNVESSLGMHSGSDEDHNRGYMNQYNQALNLKPPMSIHPSAQMNPNHHMNMVDSSGGMRYRTDEVAKRSSSHINSGSNDDAESVQQLLMEAQRLVKLTDCYGNLEGDEAGNNSPRGEGLH